VNNERSSRKSTVTRQVRGIAMNLVTYTDALEKCARMNRELENLDFIDRIPEGEVFYDVGACEGRFALYAALRGIRCYAFEPEEMNFRAMIQNQALNGSGAARNLVLLQYALGHRNHRTRLRIGQPWAGGHHKSLSDAPGRVDLDFDTAAEQEVEVFALDQVVEVMRLPVPNYIKVDVDGSEIPFIRGATATLRRPEVRGVMFELYIRDSSYGEVTRTLEASGLTEKERHEVEPGLFNIEFARRTRPPR